MTKCEFKSKLLKLHPDFNGGDKSHLAELAKLLEAKRQEDVRNKVCLCGCGKKRFKASRDKARNKISKFYSRLCQIRHRRNLKRWISKPDPA